MPANARKTKEEKEEKGKVEETRVEVGAVIHGERAERMAARAKGEDGGLRAAKTDGVAEERTEGR